MAPGKRIVISASPAAEAFWHRKATEGDALPLMPAPCHDCAVVCRFYAEIVSAVAQLPGEQQLAIVQRWFCHNNPAMACRGAADALEQTPNL